MTIRSASDGSEADPMAADRTDARMSAKMANKSLKFILTSFVFAADAVDELVGVEAVRTVAGGGDADAVVGVAAVRTVAGGGDADAVDGFE